jgi:hypothetical protein
VLRVWLRADRLFEPGPDDTEAERLTDPGAARLDSAVAPYLEHLASGVLVIEGYHGKALATREYLMSRARAGIGCDYLIGTFHLEPQAFAALK